MSVKATDIDELLKKGFISRNEKQALDKLIAELKASWPGLNVKVFGSKGSTSVMSDEESDLDIMILLPCDVTEEIRRQIVHGVFDINLAFGTNISALIMAENEWENGLVSFLPIYAYIEEEGVSL